MDVTGQPGRYDDDQLSVLMHEIPHESGDFATLLRAGFSTRQAIQAQFVTAIAAFAGTLVALVTVHHSTVSENHGERLLWFASRGFIYVATVTILPEQYFYIGR